MGQGLAGRASEAANMDCLVLGLPNENQYPFPAVRKPFSERTAGLSDDRRAVRKVPSVTDCLSVDRRSKPQLDLARIAWDQYRITWQTDVCLLRIAAAYQGIETFGAWLEGQKIRISGTYERDRRSTLALYAGYSQMEHGRLLYASVFQRLGMRDREWPITVSATFDRSEMPIGMKSGFIVK